VNKYFGLCCDLQAQRGMWRHVSYITLKWTFSLLIGVGMPFIALDLHHVVVSHFNVCLNLHYLWHIPCVSKYIWYLRT
jgi:Na+/citrate or Na+/malate symporter